jgi:hypothetical protein
MYSSGMHIVRYSYIDPYFSRQREDILISTSPINQLLRKVLYCVEGTSVYIYQNTHRNVSDLEDGYLKDSSMRDIYVFKEIVRSYYMRMNICKNINVDKLLNNFINSQFTSDDILKECNDYIFFYETLKLTHPEDIKVGVNEYAAPL